jgi:hypothetical protein
MRAPEHSGDYNEVSPITPIIKDTSTLEPRYGKI